MLAEAQAFVGGDGGRAAAIARRVLGRAADDPAIASATTVRAGIEVRSRGGLAVTSDLQLGRDLAGVDPAVASSLLPALTLRAAGTLDVTHSVTTGLGGATGATPLQADAGALRLVAGADLSAALPTAVQSEGVRGSLSIGRAAPDAFSAVPKVVVASSTGDMALAAAGDIVLKNAGAAVYTTGRGFVPDAASQPALAGATAGAFAAGGSLLVGGGALSVQAGGDIAGVPGNAFITDWWWRTEAGGWSARFAEAFKTGLATFGGGDVAVAAGGSLRDIDVVAANSGVAALPEVGAGAATLVASGGSVRLRVDGDIASVLASASGPLLSVRAGGSIGSSASTGAYNGLQLDHQATQVRVEAGSGVQVGALKSAGLIEPSRANTDADSVAGKVVTGLDGGATAAIYAWSGDLVYAARRSDVTGVHNADSALTNVVPADLTLAAPLGAVNLGDANSGVILRPNAPTLTLRVLAGRDVRLGEVLVQPVAPADSLQLRDLSGIALGDLTLSGSGSGADGGTGALAPLQAVSQQGGLSLVGTLQSARPVRLSAAGDLTLAQRGSLLVVHPGAGGDLSLLQAGRDIVFGTRQSFAAGTLEVRGSGDVLLAAGRQVDLGSSGGLVSRGNLDDSLGLSAGGANLTVVAGLNSGDLARAAQRGFVLVGGAVAGRPDLTAGLLALAGGQATDADAAAEAAHAFAALSPAEQLARAGSLIPAATFDAALRASVQALTGSGAAPSAAQAHQRFDALSALDQRRVVGQVLAAGFDALPAATRQSWLLALAGSGEVPAAYAARLAAAVAQRSGSAPRDAAAALAAFAELPPELQLLLSAQVLRDELRAGGRDAAAGGSAWKADGALYAVVAGGAAGSVGGGAGGGVPLTAEVDRNAAYATSYAAIDTLFPGVRGAGGIEMTTSQVKTQQGGGITLLAPGGGINAGALASAGSVDPNRQGIVTVAGGDILAAVRTDFAVNQSRVFTLAQGDLLLWSSDGNLDAGRGAKTVRGAPKPVYGLDRNGNVTVDTSGSFTGSGIAVLDAGSALDLYAPKGEINAGEAGIASAGRVTLAAQSFSGFDNVRFSLGSTGGPPVAPIVGATAGLASLGQPAAAAAPRDGGGEDKDDETRRRKRRRNLFLDFLGFGPGG